MSYDQDKRRDTYVLRFDEVYPGLVIHCRKPGYRALRLLASAVLVLGDDLSGRGLAGDAMLEAWGPLFEALERSVTQWNLLDRGRSVPLSQLQDQDPEFLLLLAREWYRRVVQHRPQPAGRPVEQPAPETADAPPSDQPVSPWGGPGVDEEWLAQFPMVTNPEAPEKPGEDDTAALPEESSPEPAGV